MTSILKVDTLQKADGSAFNFGKILNVETAVSNTNYSSSSTSFADAGMDITITPSATSSKILLFGSINLASVTNGLAVIGTLYADDTTNLGDSTGGLAKYDNSVVGGCNSAIIALHSPNSTSAVKYSVYVRQAGSGTHHFNLAGAESTLVAMEIAG